MMTKIHFGSNIVSSARSFLIYILLHMVMLISSMIKQSNQQACWRN